MDNESNLGLNPEDVSKDLAARKLVSDLISNSGYCAVARSPTGTTTRKVFAGC